MDLIDDLRFAGEIRAIVFDGEVGAELALAVADGARSTAVVSDQTWRNLVTNVGRAQMTKILVSETTATCRYIALSTSVIVPALADTTLPSEKIRQGLTVMQSINTYSQRYVGLFTTSSFSSTGISAEGLFDTASTGGNMWADAVISVSKSTTQSLLVDHRIQATTG